MNVVTVYHVIENNHISTSYKYKGRIYPFGMHPPSEEKDVAKKIVNGDYGSVPASKYKDIPMYYTGSRYQFK